MPVPNISYVAELYLSALLACLKHLKSDLETKLRFQNDMDATAVLTDSDIVTIKIYKMPTPKDVDLEVVTPEPEERKEKIIMCLTRSGEVDWTLKRIFIDSKDALSYDNALVQANQILNLMYANSFLRKLYASVQGVKKISKAIFQLDSEVPAKKTKKRTRAQVVTGLMSKSKKKSK